MTEAPAIDYSALLDEFRNTGGGKFTRMAYPPNGDTIFEVFRDSRIERNDTANRFGLFAPATDIYRDGKPQHKSAFFVVIYQAANGKELPVGWNGDFSKDETRKQQAEEIGANVALVPLLLPKTAASALLKLTVTDELQDGITIGEIDFESGKVVSHASHLVRMNRSKNGDKTEYTIQKIEKIPVAIKNAMEAAKVVLVPEMTLPEIAADYTAYQKRRFAEANGSATNETAKPPVAAEDFM